MIQIELHDLRFRAGHGIHEEERILGNEYLVNCTVAFHETPRVIRHIDETINYAQIYSLISERMKTPTPLLETVVMEMGYAIQESFQEIKSITLSIRKMHPPIISMEGTVGITWHKEF